MAVVTTVAAGVWSSGSTVFAGGSGVGGLPTAADTVTITHAITQDSATAVCDTLTIGSGGSLTASTSASNKLVVDKTITNSASGSNGIIYDMSSVPTLNAELYWNADRSGSGATFTNDRILTLKGAAKTAWTYASGPGVGGSIDIGDGTAGNELTADDATGWRPGDVIGLASTQAYNATPRVDILTLDGSYTPGSTTLVFTSGAVYQHDANCLVVNFTSNVKIGPATAGDKVYIAMGVQTRAALLRDVEIVAPDANYGTYAGFIFCNGDNSGFSEMSNCRFFDYNGTVFVTTNNYGGVISRPNNCYYSTKSGSAVEAHYSQPDSLGPVVSPVVLRANDGFGTYAPGMYLQDPLLSCLQASNSTIISGNTVEFAIVGGGIWSSNIAIRTPAGVANRFAMSQTRIGKGPSATANYSGARNNKFISTNGGVNVLLQDCPLNTSGGTFIEYNTMPTSAEISLLGKDADPAVQEIYMSTSNSVPAMRRNATAACINRSTSSLEMKWTLTGNLVRSRSFKILTKSGIPITLIGYFMKSGTNLPESGDVAYGSSTLPYVEISGLGITPVRITMDSGTAAGDWEKFSFLPGTGTEVVQSSGADGELTVTFVGQSAVSTARCFFSGVPFAPFVTRARHYGYLFDETIPTRTADVTKSASEATAAGYNSVNMTFSWSATAGSSTTSIIDDTTFQQLFDGHQAQAVLNVGSAIAIHGAGVAGAPSVFADGNVTLSTGKRLSGDGSLNMGSKLLTSDSPFSFTYTGGTFSRASTTATATFAGGTLNIGAAGTYTFAQASSMTVSATPTSASNYVLSSSTFTGTLTFHNTSAYNITVEVPSGTTTSSAGSPGSGTVTFVSPVIYQSVTITGFTAGSRIWIKDVTSGTVLCNATASTTNVVISGSSCIWTDPSAASATRQIALRISYVSGATAKEFIDNTNIGTCATSGSGKDVSYIATQVADATYNTNAIDGSGVSDITFTDAATDLVVCNLAGGSTTYPRIYAAFVAWLFTSAGIDDDVTYIQAPDTANYLLTAMKIRNSNATPLTITGGYGRSATTGLVADIIDVAGSTGNIYPQPDHVVAYQTTGTYAITGDISTIITSIGTIPASVLAAADADPIAANIKEVLGTAIQTGSSSTASIGY